MNIIAVHYCTCQPRHPWWSHLLKSFAVQIWLVRLPSHENHLLLQAYEATMAAGISFIDTAEVYGFGLSEQYLGDFIKKTGTKPEVATKFAPLPWRFGAGSVVAACKVRPPGATGPPSQH
jgi:diketogulonate reductase-like aldo/keto reductase